CWRAARPIARRCRTGKARRSRECGAGKRGKGRGGSCRDLLYQDVEATVVERFARRGRDRHQALAFALTLELQRAVVAERIVPRLAKQAERRPGAPGQARVGVIAGATVTPQIVDGPVARVSQRGGTLPDVAQRGVADVAAGPGVG